MCQTQVLCWRALNLAQPTPFTKFFAPLALDLIVHDVIDARNEVMIEIDSGNTFERTNLHIDVINRRRDVSI